MRQVSQYLLFYRVSGLRSLGQLFPSLSLVRGTVVFQDFAVVVYEMIHLQEIGLTSLAEITRGAVRIEKNPSEFWSDNLFIFFLIYRVFREDSVITGFLSQRIFWNCIIPIKIILVT